jgi:phosphoserine phosphatase RsbU/P
MDLFASQALEAQDPIPATAAGLDYYGHSRRAGDLQCDFFDFVRFPDGSSPSTAPIPGLLLFLGDVAGYGHSSKMIAAGIGNLLRSQPEGTLKPRVEEINRAMCDLSPNGLYVTLFCAVADPTRSRLTYVSAGHEPVILFSPHSGRLRRLESTGTVLGLTPRSIYRQQTVPVEPGDILAAFSDGISEAAGPGGEEFREDGVIQLLRQKPEAGAAELSCAILDAVQQFSGPTAADDQTIAVLRFDRCAAREPARRESVELAMAAA